jgi:hypothetical protein
MIPCRYIIATVETRPCKYQECDQPEHVAETTVFRLPDGTELATTSPGDVYIDPWSLRRQEREGTHHCQWDNCDGRHTICCLPDPDMLGGHPWNIDGRASNCTMKEDRQHRCWVRHGSPQDGNLHVDKNGPTCSAGGGSIDTGDYHGHLNNFSLT